MRLGFLAAMTKQTFQDLRGIAAETRDRKIAQIRAEYSETIADIAAIEQRLAGSPVAQRPKSKRQMPLVDLITELIPTDRIVTIDDVHGMIAGADPERSCTIATVRTTMHRLEREGTVKKVNHPQAGRKVGFCVPGFDAEAYRSLADRAAEVLNDADGPLTAFEVSVRMKEQGWVPDCSAQQAVKQVARVISSHRGDAITNG